MGYRYSYQKIVDLKTSEKTQAEWILASAIGQLREEESSLDTLQDYKDVMQQQLATASVKVTTVSELLLYQSYLTHIDQRIVMKQHEVTDAQKNVEHK